MYNPLFILMESKKEEETIKILSYNILAQNLLCDSLHITEEQVKNIGYLDIDYRINKIFEIVDTLKPDICLFQEYEHDKKLDHKFKSNKYTYEILYKKRPGDHKEGCAIAYDAKKFSLDYYCSLELRLEDQKNKFDYNNKYNYCAKKKNQFQSIYNKENVAIFLFLRSYKTNFYYLIICSHLLFNASRGDIKLGQIYQIMQSALLFKNYYKDKHITTIFGADLNSTPNSAIYEYITSQSIDVEYINKANLSGQTNKNYKTDISFADMNYNWYNEIINTYPEFKDNLIVLKNKNKKNKKKYDVYDDYDDENELILENKFVMKSFYKEKNGKEPNMTSLSASFKGTFDFLFYNTDLNLKINSVLDLPNISFDIPDKDNPSDHLPLFVEFNITN